MRERSGSHSDKLDNLLVLYSFSIKGVQPVPAFSCWGLRVFLSGFAVLCGRFNDKKRTVNRSF